MKKSILSILAVCATIAVSAQTVAVTQASTSSNTSVGITQTGVSALTLNQLGANGYFVIEQTASANSNEIIINQLGDYDDVIISQVGDGNTITINQTGTGTEITGSNFIGIFQSTLAVDNAVTVTTNGTSNNADIQQSGVTLSDITLVQNDTNNDAIILQEGGYSNLIDAEQTGTGALNTLNIVQIGGSDNDVYVSQDGGGNIFSVIQSGDLNTISGGNLGSALQSGTGNIATLTQSGSNNQIVFSQSGMSTTATFTQGGTGNIAALNVQ